MAASGKLENIQRRGVDGVGERALARGGQKVIECGTRWVGLSYHSISG